jgi:hypothetical protein
MRIKIHILYYIILYYTINIYYTILYCIVLLYYIIYEDSIRKPTKHCLKKEEEGRVLRKYKREGELIQNIPYTSVELSQWNPLVLIHKLVKIICIT